MLFFEALCKGLNEGGKLMELKIFSKTHGEKTILFDEEDYDIVMSHEWSIWKMKPSRDYLYAAKTVQLGNKKQKTVFLHRLLTNPKEGYHVDHINHNTLDNRRENLRVCLPFQNQRNLRKMTSRETTSEYKGVCFSYKHKSWLSYITVNNKVKNLGAFRTEKLACIAYNEAALKYFGEFANLNKIN